MLHISKTYTKAQSIQSPISDLDTPRFVMNWNEGFGGSLVM